MKKYFCPHLLLLLFNFKALDIICLQFWTAYRLPVYVFVSFFVQNGIQFMI